MVEDASLDRRDRWGLKLTSKRPPSAPSCCCASGFGFKRSRVQSRPEREQQPHRLITLVERYFPHRAGVAATALMLLGSAGFGIVKGGHLDELASAFSDTRNALANSAGFRITAVAINGRKQLTQDEVLRDRPAVNAARRCLFLDAAAVRDRLKANPWIGEATVLEALSGQLQIDIVERSAFALWQQDGRLSVISDDGAVLEPYVSRRFVTLAAGRRQRRRNPGEGISSRCWRAIRSVNEATKGCDPGGWRRGTCGSGWSRYPAAGKRRLETRWPR